MWGLEWSGVCDGGGVEGWRGSGGLGAKDGTTQDQDLCYRRAKPKQVWCSWTAKQLINELVETVAGTRIPRMEIFIWRVCVCVCTYVHMHVCVHVCV